MRQRRHFNRRFRARRSLGRLAGVGRAPARARVGEPGLTQPVGALDVGQIERWLRPAVTVVRFVAVVAVCRQRGVRLLGAQDAHALHRRDYLIGVLAVVHVILPGAEPG